MFLTQEPKTLEEFYKDIKFLVPKGFSLEYFVLPTTETEEVKRAVPTESYNTDSIKPDNQTNTTVVYTKKDMKNTQSFSDSMETADYAPAPMPRHVQGQNAGNRLQVSMIVTGGQPVSPEELAAVQAQNQARIVENTLNHVSVILREAVGNLPAHTLLYFTKERK